MDRSHHALCGDDSFGPAVLSPDCRGGFDFTVTFEEAILTILPTAIFLIFAPLRILGLLRSHLNIQRNALYAAKLAAVGVYTSFQLALVVVVASQPRLQTHSSIASAVLLLLTGLALAALSHLEHAKSIRPSYLIEGYLLLTAFFDIARVRTEWLLETNDAVAGIMTGSLVAKCIMLALEAMEKRSMLPGQSFSREGSGGLLSRMSFWWLNPFMLTGFRKVLAVDDLPEIHEKLDSERLANMIQGTWQNCNQKRKHALTFACLWSLRWEVVGAYIPKFVFVALRICQALLIKAATNFVDDKETPMSYGYGLIGGFAFLYLSLAIAMGWASHLTFRTMSMIRGQLISLIYNKLTTLPITNIDESSAMTLMSTDVQRITESFYYLVIDALPNTCQLGIAVYILYTNLGAVCVAPIIVTVVATALSTVTAGRVTMKQKLWFESIEKRINFTSEILGAMRNVKMLGLAHQMEKTIEQLRENEIQTSRLFRRFQAVNNAIVNLPSVFIMFFLFAAYAIVAMLSGTGSFDVSKAISSMAALNLLIEPLTQLLYAIPPGWGSLGCFTRIQEFLLEDSRVEARSFRSSTDSKATSSQEKEKGEKGGLQMQSKELTINRPYIQLEHANIGWSDAAPSVAKDVTTSIQPECKLTVIVGPVGSGKTTLLRGILGEATRVQGSVRVSTTEMAYCDQSPWIINGTIRQNVLGDSGLDQTWYDTVIQACALDVDLRQLPKGDQTIVGSKGLKLSGGQKQRLSLARAVYARKQWAILDDILSGLDSLTEEHVFKRVIGPEGLFRQIGTSVILATHSTRRLPQADLIMALNETGEIAEQGTFDKLNVPGTYVHSLKVKLEEEKGQNEQGKDNADIIDKADTADKVEPEVATEEDADESRKSGGLGTYKYYLEALGPGAVLVFVVILAVNAFLNGFQYVWVNWWAESTERGENKGLGHWLGVFAAINFLDCISLVFGIGFLWMYIIPRSGNSLHHGMVHRAIRAPLSYFSKVETGVLINRFSQDLRLADMVLPGSAVNIAYHGGSCLVVIALAITAIPYVAIALPFIGVVLFFVQRFYLRTSRQLRLLEIEQNAPLFSHFIESSSGLATIRSFGWTAEYEGKNRKYLNDSQKPFYLLLCCQRWLIFVLDLIVAGFAILIVGVAVGLRDRMSAGFFGLALVNLMYMTHSLTNLVQHWTSFETSIGAVKRIKSFAEDTPCEGSPSETDTPDPSWPSQGTLSFEDLSASYTDENSAVLRNVSFTAESGQRVGIVGRTGSGKTSALLAILRMIEVTSGKIVLDGVDLSAVAGSVVRERIICLTQDSFIFTASIRKNLDPTGVCQDEALQDALQKVGLWSILEGKAAKDTAEGIGPVLDTLMDKDFLSHGQRQLFCLARALLKQGKLLVLDEPTSSVDSETDSKMQKIIREHFSHHTIIMIAHRMSSLLDFDRVAVLEGGRLVEFGAPSELLQDTSSHFARLNKNAS